MKWLTLRFAVALFTFLLGVTTTMVWFLRCHPPAPKASHLLSEFVSTADVQKPADSVDPCSWRQQLNQVLPQLYSEYAEIEGKPSIERLISLDEKLRLLFRSRPDYYPCLDDTEYWKEEYSKLGVFLDYWSLLGYSGKLLADAHRMDPRSQYRKYTLFSTVSDVESHGGLGEMPNIEAAYRYEREFPHGPFIEETLLILADFHKDLYMVLRDDLRDYKYNCFKPYIGKSSRLAQMNRAKQRAISYYEKALSINSANDYPKEKLNDTKSRTINGWSFCAD